MCHVLIVSVELLVLLMSKNGLLDIVKLPEDHTIALPWLCVTFEYQALYYKLSVLYMYLIDVDVLGSLYCLDQNTEHIYHICHIRRQIRDADKPATTLLCAKVATIVIEALSSSS